MKVKVSYTTPARLVGNLRAESFFDQEEFLKGASRAELERYLETWGFAVHDDESTEELRCAALLNNETESK